jgi:hypothetical protein
MDWLLIALIALPVIGLAVAKLNTDAFGYPETARNMRPWYEREKYARAEYAPERHEADKRRMMNTSIWAD